MIEAREIKKTFGTLTAVDNVSFTIDSGEIFGILGPNGAGKTTILNLLCGLLCPDSGIVQGVSKRDIGLATQEIALYDDLSALDNLNFFGSLYDMPRNRRMERSHEVLNFVGLIDRGRSRVRTYSGGMKRRLNLAVALLHEPPVLLLDEPTVGVDPQSRNFIFENILELKRRGKSIVYTTHYMEEAERLCDRIAILDHGKIAALDTVHGLLRSIGEGHVVRAAFTGNNLQGIATDLTSAGHPCEVRGQTLLIKTTRPEACVAKLLQAGAALESIEIAKPSLESVFLSLTGRELRDA